MKRPSCLPIILAMTFLLCRRGPALTDNSISNLRNPRTMPYGIVEQRQAMPDVANPGLYIGDDLIPGTSDKLVLHVLPLQDAVVYTTSENTGTLSSKTTILSYRPGDKSPRVLLEDGRWHAIYPASPDQTKIPITIEPQDREHLKHQRFPTKNERELALLSVDSGSIDVIAELTDWQAPTTAWSKDGRELLVYAKLAQADRPGLYTCSIDDLQCTSILDPTSQVFDFLPLPDGRVAVAGQLKLGDREHTGVVIIGEDWEILQTDFTGPVELGYDASGEAVVIHQIAVPNRESNAELDRADVRIVQESFDLGDVEGEILATEPASGKVAIWTRPADFRDRQTRGGPDTWGQELLIVDPSQDPPIVARREIPWHTVPPVAWNASGSAVYIAIDDLRLWDFATDTYEPALAVGTRILQMMVVPDGGIVFHSAHLRQNGEITPGIYFARPGQTPELLKAYETPIEFLDYDKEKGGVHYSLASPDGQPRTGFVKLPKSE